MSVEVIEVATVADFVTTAMMMIQDGNVEGGLMLLDLVKKSTVADVAFVLEGGRG